MSWAVGVDPSWWSRGDERWGGYVETDGPDDPDGLEDRVTHLVFVAGRLVEQWVEPVRGSRWEGYAERWRHPCPPPPDPLPPRHERALRWLDAVCGGRAAVLRLDSAPLEDDGRDLPEAATAADQQRLADVAELLDGFALRFEAETGHALRSALVSAWEADPTVVTGPRTAAATAGAIAWVVTKANAMTHPAGPVRLRSLQDAFALPGSPAAHGRVVQRALVGFRDEPRHAERPDGLPELLAVGDPRLLVSAVRVRLVRVRDRALAAQDEAQDQATA